MRNVKHPQSRTWKSPEGVEFTCSLVLVDATGHAWYAFDDPLKMPAARAIEAELAAEWSNLNITPDDFDAFCNEMRDHGNKGNIVSLFSALDRMQERRKWACEGKTLLELAKVYFMVDDEPLEMSTEKHNAIKEQVWKEDGVTRAFFLRRAFVLTRGFSEFSEKDILTYLSAQETVHLKKFGPKQNGTGASTERKPSRQSFMSAVKNSTRRRS